MTERNMGLISRRSGAERFASYGLIGVFRRWPDDIAGVLFRQQVRW
jgi:hypothetical protein